MINIKHILLANQKKLKKPPKNSSFICLYSGGKDSALALSIASEFATPSALITCVGHDKSLFHEHSYDIIKTQSKKMNINLECFNGHWKELIKLAKIYKYYKKKGVKTVVFGDLNDIKNANRKIIACKLAGLKPCMPLWNVSYDELINLIKKYNIVSVITIVRPSMLDVKWLGKEFNQSIYESLCGNRIDPFGEKGEFHTTLVNSNLFSSPINYSINNIFSTVDKFGVKECANIEFLS